MIIKEENHLSHIGTPRKSGRYPWGSGDNPHQSSGKTLIEVAQELHKEGMSDPKIAESLGMTTTRFRALKSIGNAEKKASDIAFVERLVEKSYSNVEIGKRFNPPRNESSVRALREPGAKDKADNLQTIARLLKDQVTEKTYVGVGTGVERNLNISKEKLNTAIAILEEEGYKTHVVNLDQLSGYNNNKTKEKVLTPPGTTYVDAKNNIGNIRQIDEHFERGGRTILGLLPPKSISSKRIAIRYDEDGGGKEDGMIYVRRGAKDLSLGKSHYAQVRIMVDNDHYLKGMAMYKDGLPPGKDLLFNTSNRKSETASDIDVMKPVKRIKATGEIDMDNPFGSAVHQLVKEDAHGEPILDAKGHRQLKSAMNVVYEEGAWEKWTNSLASQMLSKQTPTLAKEQLDKTYDKYTKDFAEFSSLTNPTVRKKLLETFAETVDSSAAHLKAAHMPRQGSHVLLPITSMKETEIYAPNYDNGDHVVLIRYPHGGIFEIPELTVNNKHPEAKRLLGLHPKDAVGINSKVAERMSGADFDGDSVLVILNNSRKIQTKPPLEGLKDFDPIHMYPEYSGMKLMTKEGKATQMGMVSNLITDMSIKKAPLEEMAQAVRHSMVVIDAEKHKLNYKQSELDNNIRHLRVKYQNSPKGGATTLISLAGSTLRIPEIKLRKAKFGGPVDPATGKKVWVKTNRMKSESKAVTDPETGKKTYVRTGNLVPRLTKVRNLAYVDDARTLSSGSVMEEIYATHSNKLKALANKARKDAYFIKHNPHQSAATKAYAKEVESLNAKLNIAMKNRPLERQALAIANNTVSIKRRDNPDMDAKEIKRLNYLAKLEARNRTGASRKDVEITITPNEWAAIQAGAITTFKLTEILKNADIEKIKKLAMPKAQTVMSQTRQRRAEAMVTRGATLAEVASALGVSLSTLKRSLYGEGES